MAKIINIDPELMGGTPVFMGTRVPVEFLLSYLVEGGTVEEFLNSYPSVCREQAISFLNAAGHALIQQEHGAVAA